MIQLLPAVASILCGVALVCVVVVLVAQYFRDDPRSGSLRERFAALVAGAATTLAMEIAFAPTHNQVNWNLGVAVAPLCGAFVAIVVVVAVPPKRLTSLRSADLARRRFPVMPRGVIPAGIGVVALALLLVSTSLAATPGNPFATDPVFGSEVTVVTGNHSYTAGGGVYPGWYFVIPMLVGVVVLVLAGALGFARTVSAPRRETIVTVVVLGILGTAAGAVFVAGGSTMNASMIIHFPHHSGTFTANQLYRGWSQPAYAVSWIETITGYVLLVALVVLGVAYAVRLVRSLVRSTATTSAVARDRVDA